MLLRAFVAQAFRIPSGSMEPQLLIGDRVVVSRLAYDVHDPRRGDVIVFDCPPRAGCDQPEEHSAPVRALQTLAEALLLRQPEVEEYIKRVIALPGETIEYHDGVVTIDGRPLVEPYIAAGEGFGPDIEPLTVPEGHVWVMGDNRDNSSDSRIFGPVDVDTIVGRAILRVWPPQRTAFL